MPLPNLTTRCTARCRARNDLCLNPAAYGCKTCRMHGARRPETVRKGEDHPQYRHGLNTQTAKEEYRRAMGRLRVMTQIVRKVE
jgi:hypothetical protein